MRCGAVRCGAVRLDPGEGAARRTVRVGARQPEHAGRTVPSRRLPATAGIVDRNSFVDTVAGRQVGGVGYAAATPACALLTGKRQRWRHGIA